MTIAVGEYVLSSPYFYLIYRSFQPWHNEFLVAHDRKKEKNPHAVALGKLGGAKGGRTRAAKLTPEERSASARKAALARWAKERKKKQPAS